MLFPVGDGLVTRGFVGRESADEEFDQRVAFVELVACGEPHDGVALGLCVRVDEGFDDPRGPELVGLVDLVGLGRVQLVKECRGSEMAAHDLLVGGIGARGEHAGGIDEFLRIV